MTPHLDDTVERRKQIRQPLNRELRFRTLGQQMHSGAGVTLNISSNAVAFYAVSLPTGAPIEISVSWPTEVGSTLRLVATGRIVRSARGIAVCTMERSTFRADDVERPASDLRAGASTSLSVAVS